MTNTSLLYEGTRWTVLFLGRLSSNGLVGEIQYTRSFDVSYSNLLTPEVTLDLDLVSHHNGDRRKEESGLPSDNHGRNSKEEFVYSLSTQLTSGYNGRPGFIKSGIESRVSRRRTYVAYIKKKKNIRLLRYFESEVLGSGHTLGKFWNFPRVVKYVYT